MVHKQSTKRNHVESIQVSIRGNSNSLYMCTKAFKSHPKRCGEPSCLDHTKCKDQAPPNSCSPITSPYLHAIPTSIKPKRSSLPSDKCQNMLITIKSRFMSIWFSEFPPLDECVDNKWAQIHGLRGKGRKAHPSDRKPDKGKEQSHLAWEETQRPHSTQENLDPHRHGQQLDTTETQSSHDP